MPHQRPDRGDRAGPARHAASRSGSGAGAVCSTSPRSRRRSATSNATRAICPAHSPTCWPRPGRPPSPSPTMPPSSTWPRHPGGPTTRRSAPTSPPTAGPPTSRRWPASATTTWPSRAGRRPPASWPGSARPPAPTNPTSRATRSSWPPSTRPRASSGRWSTWPGSSRASCPSATPAPPTTWPRSDACSTWRSPGPNRRCAARGPRAAPSASAPRRATRSPYLDEVESACHALLAGERPHRLGGAPVGRSGPHSAPRRRPARARRGARRTGRAGAPAIGRDDLDPAGAATFEALKSWRTRQAKAADVPAYVIFQDRVLLELASTPAREPGRRCWRWPASARSRSTASATRSSPSWPSTRHPERVRFQIRAALRRSVDEVARRCSPTPPSTPRSSGCPRSARPR